MRIRHGPGSSAVAAALLGSLVVATAGCGPQTRQLEDGERLPDPVVEIRINGGSGSVRVLGDNAASGTQIQRTVRYVGQAPAATIRHDRGVLFLSTDCGANCSASYVVHTARGVRVTGENGSGSVDLTGVSDVDVTVGSGELRISDATGGVSATTDSGRIELSNVAGDATATTGSGAVAGRDLRGARTTVRVGSGDITLDLAGVGDVAAHSESGSIEVRVPDGCCRVTAETGSGQQTIDVATNPTGASELDLRAESGDITVRATGS